ncbi:MAG: sialidase family protein, partial [Pseudonocardiaceae bacterium]
MRGAAAGRQRPRARRALALAGIGTALAFGAGGGSTALAASYSGTAQNGFIAPVRVASSTGLGEPTIVHDHGAGNGGVDRLFVTAPQGLGSAQAGGSPLFTSIDGGATWGAPVRSVACTGLSGGDTDLTVDGSGNVYQTDLSLANSCLSVSEDHGATFAGGDAFGSNLQPGDDRPWIVWNKISNQNYLDWDGLDALHSGNTAYIAAPFPLGTQVTQDTAVVPESAVNTSNTPDSVRECVCPPGGIAVDDTSGAHSGRVYVSYSYQHGTAVSYSDLTGTGCPAPPAPGPPSGVCTANLTWTGPVAVPNSDPDSTGSAFTNEFNFDPIRVDGNGNAYVMWAHGVSFNTSTNVAASVQEEYAYSTDGGATWSNPILLSTEGGTTTLPTMDVVGPGVVDFAWYGAPQSTDPNKAAGPWNVYYERVSNAATATPTITTGPEVAIAGMHTGCIQTGGGASCTDRSLLDFFTLTDTQCTANIIYTGGDVSAGVDLYFTKLANCGSNPVVPESPWAPLLLLPGGAVA